MSSGNTLLAHAVGAGKTFTMAATGMKMKQAGLVKKPMYVVPNHMLEQFAREFMQLYPNAKLLVAAKEDLARDRRKLLTAKIASGEWDGIIVTHSSFERIGMSRDYQEQFLREQIEEYDQLLCDGAASDATRAHRNIIKTIEKQKASREERLKDLLAEDKKDDGLVFDELGVDHVFIDEAQYFKNLETPTKMERVAGIQTGGSERAFDLYMKARYLRRAAPRPRRHLRHRHADLQHDGRDVHDAALPRPRGAAGAAASSISTPGRPPSARWSTRWKSRRTARRCGPAAASPASSTCPNSSRCSGRSPTCRRPRCSTCPGRELEGGKPHRRRLPDVGGAARPPAGAGRPLRAAAVAEGRSAGGQRPGHHHRRPQARPRRPDALRHGAGLPRLEGQRPGRERRRHLAADRRDARHADDLLRHGRQPDALGLLASMTRSSRSSIARGIPREQIAAIGDADSDAKKQALFERVRSGQVRVLIGSTQKMGTGTNVQKRLVALHHLDAPWKPAEVEQREGRILRQGNENEEVAIYRYVTEGSFDAYMWQALETKARFIAQVMTGDSAVRRAEDIGGQELSYAEVKAIASGNPAVLTLAEADAELQRLAVLKKNHADEQYLARRSVRELPETIDRLTKRLARPHRRPWRPPRPTPTTR